VIIVIAAEPGVTALLEEVLGRTTMAPVRSAAPERALELVASEGPRLVLVDLDQPGGSDLLVTCSAQSGPPVIAIAPAGAADARQRARAAGAYDFLTKPLDATEVVVRVENVLAAAESEQTRRESVERLARLAEYRDDATYEHPQRVGRTAALLAERLGLAPNVVAAIDTAAPLHDVGKVGVPDRILLKPSRLTGPEFELMKSHTLIGAEILAGSTWPILQLAEEIALSHHERWDGSGYPDGKVEDAIPMSGRIVIVADYFDALTHSRPYAEAWEPDRAAAEIRRQSGQHFDPDVVEAFDALDLEFLLSPMV
jgi:putative two-component system response regulator